MINLNNRIQYNGILLLNILLKMYFQPLDVVDADFFVDEFGLNSLYSFGKEGDSGFVGEDGTPFGSVIKVEGYFANVIDILYISVDII